MYGLSSNATSLRKRRRFYDVPMEVFSACVVPFLDNVAMLDLVRVGTTGMAWVVSHLNSDKSHGGKHAVAWCLRYEICLRSRHRLGLPWAVRLGRFNRLFMPRVMSRACRGCGRNTERKVLGRVPLCERCTKNKKMKWCMVKSIHFRSATLKGIYVHSGRRANLVFVQDVVDAASVPREIIFSIVRNGLLVAV